MKEQTTRTPPKLRVLSAFLAVAMLLTLLPAAAFAAPAPESDFEYSVDNGTAAINTETCTALGLDFDTVSKAFEPYCTKITTLTTAESFS